jgi:hypothetical protein
VSGSWKSALLGAVVVLAAAPVASWHLLFGASSAPADHDRASNGVHLDASWLAGDAGVPPARLALSMQGLGLRTAYATLGVVDDAGRLVRRAGDGARVPLDVAPGLGFLSALREAAPGVRVFPSIGGTLARDVRPADPDQRAGIARTVGSLVASGAQGVHLRVQGATTQTPGFLALVEHTRRAAGDGTVSVQAALPGTAGETIGGLVELCGAADELVIPLHGTGARSPLVYESQVAWATRRLARALPPPESGGCMWSLEVPTVDRATELHDPRIETLSLSVAGVRRGLGDDSVPVGFAGVVLQDASATSMREWGTFDAAWRGRPGTGVAVPGGPDGV